MKTPDESTLESKLPEKWCIKITKENQREIGEWFNSNIEDHGGNDFDYYRGYHGMYYHYPEFATPDNSKAKYVVGPDIQIGYTRITIEEFRQITGGKSAEKVFNKLVEDIQDLKTKMKKPPLGLFPRNIWEENVRKERTQQVLEAVNRYVEDNRKVPSEWMSELAELVGLKEFPQSGEMIKFNTPIQSAVWEQWYRKLYHRVAELLVENKRAEYSPRTLLLHWDRLRKDFP